MSVSVVGKDPYWCGSHIGVSVSVVGKVPYWCGSHISDSVVGKGVVDVGVDV